MKQENYLKVLDKKKNNEEAQQVNIKSIEEEIKKYLRQQEQERNVEITTNELKNKIIMFVSEHIENWNLDKDYVNQEGMIDTNKLIGKIFDDILNYGIIQKLVEDPEVTEINSNGRYIFYEIKGRRRPAYDERGARIKFSSPEEQETCITTLIGNNDITFDNRNRLINVKTYEGYRLSATYKTARTQVNKVGEDDYSDFTLRKFKEIPYTLKELCKMHTLTDNMARIMKMTVNNTTHVFCGVVGSGKAVTYDTDIITPTGKVKARDIKVGDIVYDGLGNETKILGVYPQPKQDIYRIKFIDGYVDTSLDHINTLYKKPPYKPEKERKEGEPFCDEDTFCNDVIDYMGNAKEELRIDITTKELLKMTRREWTKLYMVRPSKLCKEWREKESLSIRPVIENIEKKEQQEECVCFMVESSHHTYLVNDYVVTHNTTSHRAELEHIKNNKRVGVVQYPSEINLCKYDKNGNLINDVFQWEAVDSQKQSKAINTQVNLMAHELRNSPEISITNEVRYAEEFWNFLLLTKEGARASTSFHASNSIEAIERMTNEICGHTHQDYKVVLKQVTSGLELIYIQEKLEDGTRKIMQISEVIGCKGDEPIINDIYVFVPNGINKIDKETGEILEIGGTHKMIGTFSDKFKKKLKLKGVSKEEIEQLEKYKVNSEDEETIERYTGEGI